MVSREANERQSGHQSMPTASLPIRPGPSHKARVRAGWIGAGRWGGDGGWKGRVHSTFGSGPFHSMQVRGARLLRRPGGVQRGCGHDRACEHRSCRHLPGHVQVRGVRSFGNLEASSTAAVMALLVNIDQCRHLPANQSRHLPVDQCRHLPGYFSDLGVSSAVAVMTMLAHIDQCRHLPGHVQVRGVRLLRQPGGVQHGCSHGLACEHRSAQASTWPCASSWSTATSATWRCPARLRP